MPSTTWFAVMNVPSAATKNPVPSTESVSATVPFTLMQAIGMTECFIAWMVLIKLDCAGGALAAAATAPPAQLKSASAQSANQKILNRPTFSPPL